MAFLRLISDAEQVLFLVVSNHLMEPKIVMDQSQTERSRSHDDAPGMADKVVHGDLHYLALQDVPQCGDDEVVVEGI